jgi:Zn-finger protein
MALRTQCIFCGEMTIPRRLLAFYVGSSDSLKVWECRECSALWSEKMGEQELVA